MSIETAPSRREFVAGTVVSALSAGRTFGANERIGVGLIGFGLIGKQHAFTFKELAGVQMVGVAEAHQGRLDEAAAYIGGDVMKYRDFRKLLDDRRVDAVIVATPDHWHALMTMMACAAGKDVYVEKPVTLFPAEGRWMLNAARKHKRIVQVGTQQRSGSHYAKARELVRAGRLGKIVSVRMNSFRNVMPGFGNSADQDPPAGFDWDMFLGPAPARKFNPNRGLYHFRWFWDTAGGQMVNLGQHSLDFVDWCLGPLLPRSVVSFGGRYALGAGGETPDTQDALFDFGDWSAVWSHREAAHGSPASSAIEIYGTKGCLAISRKGFTLTPDKKVNPANAIPRFTGDHPVGGPNPQKETAPLQFWTEPLKDESGDSQRQVTGHARDFLDCIKTRREPISDLDSGQRVATLCHLANISLRLGRQLRWDPKTESVLGDEEAVKMLTRNYRAPWDKELARVR